MKRFSKIAVGGTFDYFHKGHKTVLKKAIRVSEILDIGLTSDQWVKRKPLSKQIQLFSKRKKIIKDFLKTQKFKEFEIIKLDDIYGTTLKNPKIEALVVSNKTLAGAKKVNLERKKRGLKPLPIILAKTELSENNHCISSEYIRKGLTNREGKVYSFVFKKGLRLAEKARFELKKPQGRLLIKNILKSTREILDKDNFPFICLVGDYTTQFFIKNNLKFDIAVIDNRIVRKPTKFVYKLKPVFKAKNPRGGVSRSLVKAIKLAIRHKSGLIKVSGEEDLATVALVLSLPLDSLVIYGQPQEGSVVIRIDEEIKEKFYRLLR